MQAEVDDGSMVDQFNDTETVHSISEDDKSKVLHNIEKEITGMRNVKYLFCITKPNICFNNLLLYAYHCYVSK